MTNEETQNQEKADIERSGLPREEVLALLRARLLQTGQRTLKDEYGTPRRGIVTGLDEAFIVDSATRDALIAADRKSEELLKPYAFSSSINRWGAGEPSAWIIYTVPGKVNIEDYPAIRAHLAQSRERLAQRTGGGEWFELSQVELAPAKQVVDMQIVFPQKSDWPGFMLQKGGTVYCEASLNIPNGDYFLTGVLNSRLFWFLMQGMSQVGDDGVVSLQPEHLEQLPWPMAHVDHIAWIGSFSDFCHNKFEERNNFQSYMREEIAKHLAPGGKVSELSEAMTRWYIMDAEALNQESLRHFGQGIPADKMQMWGEFLQSAKYELNMLNSEIAMAEGKLDREVYRMFDLTEEEIEYLGS